MSIHLSFCFTIGVLRVHFVTIIVLFVYIISGCSCMHMHAGMTNIFTQAST